MSFRYLNQHYGSPVGGSDEEAVVLASARPKKRAGRKKFKETRHPVYRGVRQRNSKWVCEVREPHNPKSRIWLGTFPTAEMAARAHDVAALALSGRGSTTLNFADSAWRLPVPGSTDTREIQRAAAEAAEAFRPAPETAAAVEVMAPEEEGSGVCVDEDDFFRMPSLLADMYEGLLLPPPPQGGSDFGDDEVESDVDLPLWSYSI